MTVRDVGGCLIDLTRRDRQSDQLSAFYPGAPAPRPEVRRDRGRGPEIYEAAELDRVFVQAAAVTLRLVATPREKEPDVEVSYTLEDGWPYVLVTTDLRQPRRTTRSTPSCSTRSAPTARSSSAPRSRSDLFWAYDKHFGQAYGVVADGHDDPRCRRAGSAAALPGPQTERSPSGSRPATSYRLTRRIIPGANLFDVRRLSPTGWPERRIVPVQPLGQGHGRPARRRGRRRARRRTASRMRGAAPTTKGSSPLDPGDAPGSLTVSALGRGSKTVPIAPEVPESPLAVELPEPGKSWPGSPTNGGGTIPCKVQFIGRDGTPSPDFGPDSGEHAVKNVYYSHDGRFRRELAPGLLRRDRQPRPGVRRRLHADRGGRRARRRGWRRSWSARSRPTAGSAPTSTAIPAPRATTRRASSAGC